MRILFVVMVVFALAEANALGYSLGLNCNETSGTVAHDSSTNCFDFQVSGASWTMGIAGNGLLFDGMDDYLATTNRMCLNKLGSFWSGTVAVSFRLEKLPHNDVEPIFYFGQPGGSCINIEVGHYNAESKLYFTVITNGIPLCFDSNVNLQTNVWYRFAVVVGTNFNTGYLNGMELINRHYNYGNAQSSFFLASVEHTVCWLGKSYISNPEPRYFNGEIDEFRIYQRAFDSQEVSAIYNALMSVAGVSIERQGTRNILLRWPSQLHQKFDVLHRMSLANLGPWMVLISNLPSADAETFFLHTDEQNPRSGFYRVRHNPY